MLTLVVLSVLFTFNGVNLELFIFHTLIHYNHVYSIPRDQIKVIHSHLIITSAELLVFRIPWFVLVTPHSFSVEYALLQSLVISQDDPPYQSVEGQNPIPRQDKVVHCTGDNNPIRTPVGSLLGK